MISKPGVRGLGSSSIWGYLEGHVEPAAEIKASVMVCFPQGLSAVN